VVIDRVRTRLHHENIRAAHVLKNLVASFPVRKAAVLSLTNGNAEIAANRLCKRSVRSPAEDFASIAGQSFPLNLQREFSLNENARL
jgi:hypothetical protein